MSDTTTIDFKSADALRVVLSSLHIYTLILSSLFLFVEWKEKQLGKTSISLSLGENSLLNELKDRKTLLILLSMFTIVLWDTLDMNNFYFLFLLFSDFIRILFSFSFFFSFGQWRSIWHRSHMTCHMMWCHKPRTW